MFIMKRTYQNLTLPSEMIHNSEQKKYTKNIDQRKSETDTGRQYKIIK